MKQARYIGGDVFRIGDKPYRAGDVVQADETLVEALLLRPDFQPVEEPKKSRKAKDEE